MNGYLRFLLLFMLKGILILGLFVGFGWILYLTVKTYKDIQLQDIDSMCDVSIRYIGQRKVVESTNKQLSRDFKWVILGTVFGSLLFYIIVFSFIYFKMGGFVDSANVLSVLSNIILVIIYIAIAILLFVAVLFIIMTVLNIIMLGWSRKRLKLGLFVPKSWSVVLVLSCVGWVLVLILLLFNIFRIKFALPAIT